MVPCHSCLEVRGVGSVGTCRRYPVKAASTDRNHVVRCLGSFVRLFKNILDGFLIEGGVEDSRVVSIQGV